MNLSIVIEPHERELAVKTYAKRITAAQRQRIEAAPLGALIHLYFPNAQGEGVLTVIEEG